MPASRRDSSRGPPNISRISFADLLGEAAFWDPPTKKHKVKLAPVYRRRGGTANSSIVRIRPLQYMVLIDLRRQIAHEAKRLYDSRYAGPEEMEILRKLLRDFTQALQDWKFMLETPGSTPRIAERLQAELEIEPKVDPNAGDGTDLDAGILYEAGLMPPHSKKWPLHVSDFYGVSGRSHRYTMHQSNLQALFKRLAVACFGGAAVVGPMLIMTIYPTQLKALLTTSLFVLLVAVILATFVTDAAPKDILAATAAYAAVLVVFVGTSFGPT